MAPSAVLTRRKTKQKRWQDIDYALAEAVHILDKEKCGKCGTPAWLAFSENPYILFEMEEIKCEACAVADQDNEKQKDKTSHGVTRIPKAVHADWEFEKDGEKSPLPGRRDWYEELANKNK